MQHDIRLLPDTLHEYMNRHTYDIPIYARTDCMTLPEWSHIIRDLIDQNIIHIPQCYPYQMQIMMLHWLPVWNNMCIKPNSHITYQLVISYCYLGLCLPLRVDIWDTSFTIFTLQFFPICRVDKNGTIICTWSTLPKVQSVSFKERPLMGLARQTLKYSCRQWHGHSKGLCCDGRVICCFI